MSKKADSFDKETLLKSKRFQDHRDILTVVLSDKKRYTIGEVQKLVENFLTKEVK